MRSVIVAAIVTVTLLAGCTSDEPSENAGTDEGAKALAALHGWVFSQADVPLVGATVEVLEVGLVVTTNPEGFYEFTEELPVNQPLIVVTRQDTFKPSSSQVTLPLEGAVRLNFTLEAEPILVPDVVVLPHDGFLNCQYNADVLGNQYVNDCSGGSGGDIWEFAVGPNLAGVVVEIGWTPNTEFSRYLHAKLETQNVGDQTLVLSETVTESVMRLQVAEQFTKKYYPAGGIMRLSVNVDPNNADQETGVGASVAVSQDFKVFASLFYVEPPGQSYSFQG